MDIHEAITEARENIVANYSTEKCVVSALLEEIDRLSGRESALYSAALELMLALGAMKGAAVEAENANGPLPAHIKGHVDKAHQQTKQAVRAWRTLMAVFAEQQASNNEPQAPASKD